MKKAFVMFVGLAAFLLVAFAPSALADPDKSKNAEFITIDCEGVSVDLVLNAKSNGKVAHDVDSTSVGVAKSLTTKVFLVATGDLVFEDSFSAGKGVKGLTTCTATIFDVDPMTGADVRIEVEAKVLITPRGK